MPEDHDTIIIGGGQAGLAMSSILRRYGREHIVLERRRIAERWRTERWDSLRFQFPNWSVELPGFRYSGDDPDGFAHYTEIARIIADYAQETTAPIREGAEVLALNGNDHGGFVLTTQDGSMQARRVVIATGPFQQPLVPELAQAIAPSVYQTDPPGIGLRPTCHRELCSSLAAGPRATRSPTSSTMTAGRCISQ
jgi:putative flavoprotein involved in K+ transport